MSDWLTPPDVWELASLLVYHLSGQFIPFEIKVTETEGMGGPLVMQYPSV